jgi:sortase A
MGTMIRVPKLLGALLVAATTVTACGDDQEAAETTAAAVTTVRPTATTARPAATEAPTTTRPRVTTTTTAAPTTIAAPTTTAAPETTTTELVTTTTEPPTTLPETTLPPPPPPPPTAAPAVQPVVTSATLPQPVAPPPPRANEQHVQVGTIEIPKIGVTKPMLEGISLNTLDKGPGHWPGTAMPGRPGNVVVAGHRTSKDRPFRHIDQLVPGDEVVFTTDEGRFVYLVTGTQIVLPDAMWIVGQTPASTATLFACHPVGSTRERIVVFLQLQA